MDEPSVSYIPADTIKKSLSNYSIIELRNSYGETIDRYHLDMICEFSPEFISLMFDRKLNGATIVEQIGESQLDEKEKKSLTSMLEKTEIGQLPEFRLEQNRLFREMKKVLREITLYDVRMIEVNKQSNNILRKIVEMQREIEEAAVEINRVDDFLQSQAVESAEIIFSRFRNLGTRARKKYGQTVVSKKDTIKTNLDLMDNIKTLVRTGLYDIRAYTFSPRPCLPVLISNTFADPDCKFPRKFEEVPTRLNELVNGMNKVQQEFTEGAVLVAKNFSEDVKKFCKIQIEYIDNINDVTQLIQNLLVARIETTRKKTAFLKEVENKEKLYTRILFEFKKMVERVNKIERDVTEHPWHV